MSNRRIIVDGYNVIRADPVLSGLEQTSLEEGRAQLVRLLSASSRFLGDSVEVVFDGSGSRSYATNERFGHVTSIYSPAGQSADDVIKATVSGIRDRSNVVVVTNDMDIKGFCQSLGATVTGSENLVEQMATPKRLHRVKAPGDDEAETGGTGTGLDTRKKGNPRKLPKRLRHPRDYRF